MVPNNGIQDVSLVLFGTCQMNVNVFAVNGKPSTVRSKQRHIIQLNTE